MAMANKKLHTGTSKVHKNLYTGEYPIPLNKYKVEKAWEREGLKCVVARMWKGHLCGYVGIKESSKLNGLSYGDFDEICVHGGVSFLYDNRDGYPIATEETKFFIGFDCDGNGDAPDLSTVTPISRKKLEREIKPGDTVRALDFAIAETNSMADQLVKMERKLNV